MVTAGLVAVESGWAVGVVAALVGALAAAMLAVGVAATGSDEGAPGSPVPVEPVGGASEPAQAARVSNSHILSRLMDVMDFMVVLQRLKGTRQNHVPQWYVLCVEAIALRAHPPIVTARVTKRWRS